MNPEEVHQQICRAICVTRQDVIIAEAFIRECDTSDTTSMMKQFSVAMEMPVPEKVILDASTIEKTVRELARSLSWRLAYAEAVWSLIHNGIFLVASDRSTCVLPNVGWSDRGTSSGWSFSDFQVEIPSRIRIAQSVLSSDHQPLANADLYLHELNIPGLDPDVEIALREGVSCFRHGLNLACLAMLGKACEGAWHELGMALLAVLPQDEAASGQKVSDTLTNRNSSVMKKIDVVINLYGHKDVFKATINETGIKPDALRSVVIWADVVRDSRNAVHYGADPAMGNTYEKVAALLMGAVPNLRMLYRVKAALGGNVKGPL